VVRHGLWKSDVKLFFETTMDAQLDLIPDGESTAVETAGIRELVERLRDALEYGILHGSFRRADAFSGRTRVLEEIPSDLRGAGD